MESKQLIRKEHTISGRHGRPITLDVAFYRTIKASATPLPLVIFCHGFKGFKDWGTFPLVAERIAASGFFFLKLNFSHNGTTPDQMDDIHDLDAFGKNNFEIELDDLGTVIDWVYSKEFPYINECRVDNLSLIGHSRGGGIALLKTVEDSRVSRVACWATVNDLEKYMYLSDPEQWKETGVSYVQNSRTGVQLPLYYQFYENFYRLKHRFDIRNNLEKLDKPLILLHGTLDSVVPIEDSEWIYEHFEHAIMVHVEGGDHTFGGKHPWDKPDLPEMLNFVLEETIEFFTF